MTDAPLPSPSHPATRVTLAPGASGAVWDAVAGCGAQRALVVVGTVRERDGWQRALLDAARRRGHPVVSCGGGLPTVERVQSALDAARTERFDAVVAVGGGGVIDSAKAVALLTRDPRPLAVALRERAVVAAALPLVTVPTLFGTGAEVTATATIWDPAAGVKHSLASPALEPAAALVDPDLSATAPLWAVRAAALDALAQGVEGAWSVRADAESAAYGLGAVELLRVALPALAGGAPGAELRALLARASVLGGFAIARGGTTACHAISYPLTLRYGVAHGVAAAATLGALTAYNAGASGAGVRARVAAVCAALGAPDAAAAAALLDDLWEQVAPEGLPDAIDLDHVAAEAARSERLLNNPRAIDAGGLRALLDAVPALGGRAATLATREGAR